MKKFILILFAVLMTAVCFAQDDTYYFKRSTDTYMYLNADETITTGDSIYLCNVDLKRDFPYMIDAYLSIDSVNYETNDTLWIVLQGKIFEGQSWTTISTNNSKLPTATVTSTFALTTAIYRYRFLRFYLWSKDADTNWKVNTIELKVTPGNLTDEVN